MWVSHPNPGGSTLLITRMAYGTIWLLNADAEDAPRVRLVLRTKHDLRPFLSTDGRLHFIEILGKPSTFCDTCWHTVDTATGATLASERKLKWHPALSREGSLCQAQTQRILAMADAHTITVLDACGLQEVADIVVAPRHERLSPEAFRISSIRWSHDGAWLAVLLHSMNPEASTLPLDSEVHIYTASGASWQSLSVKGEAALSWSPGFAYLAVHSNSERPMPDASGCPSSERDAAHFVPVRKGAIWLLNPSENMIIPVPENLVEANRSSRHGWSRCWWSSHGGLLIAEYDSLYYHILDGETGLLVYGNVQDPRLQWGHASWASHVEAACVSGGQAESTLNYINFQFIDGMWAPSMLELATTVHARNACISPYGTSIAIQGPDSHSTVSSIDRYDLDIGQSRVRIRRHRKTYENSSDRKYLAPLPGAWPVVDAKIIHDHRLDGSGRPKPYLVELVQGFDPHVLGTWAADDLLELAQGRVCVTAAPCETIEECTWAPNSRHLAVLCNKRMWGFCHDI